MSKYDADFKVSGADLEQAVSAGILSEKHADALVAFVARPEKMSNADEEQFRFISGFNDIFVTIGAVLFLWALVFLLGGTGPGAFVVAAAAWGLAEIFTKRKRQALPSIVLLIAFSLATFFGIASVLQGFVTDFDFDVTADNAWTFALSGLLAAAAIYLHWMRFQVPITVAAGSAALTVTIVAILESVLPNSIEKFGLPIFGIIGLAIFALAMRFDLSDRARITRRTDIAFWLHMLAAPMIIHPLVNGLTTVSTMTPRDASIIFGLFVGISIIALIVDRRALLVSSLSYLGYAVGSLLLGSNFGSQTFAVAILAVGAIVLILSIAWQPLRKIIMGLLHPAITQRVPIAN